MNPLLLADWPQLPPLGRDGWELATWIVIGLVVLAASCAQSVRTA